jgi:hypothetical protein
MLTLRRVNLSLIAQLVSATKGYKMDNTEIELRQTIQNLETLLGKYRAEKLAEQEAEDQRGIDRYHRSIAGILAKESLTNGDKFKNSWEM